MRSWKRSASPAPRMKPASATVTNTPAAAEAVATPAAVDSAMWTGSRSRSRKNSMHDKRLLGTWKSDKTRTFAEYAFRRGVPANRRKRIMALFGKLTVTYKRSRVYTNLNGFETRARYKVLAKDSESV